MGHLDAVKFLIERGADIHAHDIHALLDQSPKTLRHFCP